MKTVGMAKPFIVAVRPSDFAVWKLFNGGCCRVAFVSDQQMNIKLSIGCGSARWLRAAQSRATSFYHIHFTTLEIEGCLSRNI
jgi:hypothetical protein